MKLSTTERAPLRKIIAALEPGVSVDGLDRPALPDEKGVLKISAVSGGIYDASANKAVRAGSSRRLGPCPMRGDLLISRANTAELVGSAAIVTETDLRLTLPDKLWRVRLHDEGRDSIRWLYHVMNSPAMRKQLRARASGTGAGMKNLSQQVFLSLSVMRSSRAIQDAVVAVLDSVAGAELALTHQMSLCASRQSGLAKELLTGRRRYPEFRHSVRRTRAIAEVLEIASRPVEWADEAEYELLSVRRRSGGTFQRERRRGAEIKGKSLFRVEDGDFLISRMQAAHGAFALVRPEHAGMHVSGMYDVLRTREPHTISIQYFDYLSRLPEMYRRVRLACHGVHIEKMTFSLPAFLKIPIEYPESESEQRQVVKVLDALEREMRLLEMLLQQLKVLRRGLMDRLLCGEENA